MNYASKFDEPARFTVRGKGIFPADMLRHDHCWPVDGDINCISNPNLIGRGNYATIVLCAQSRRGITPNRWASFGWAVTEIDGDMVIP